MKTMNKLAAVALTLCAATTAQAGKGGSNQAIVDAVNSGSQDAILAEVERAEGLICEDCIQTVTNLTEDSRYAVREVAAWWFGKRPGLQRLLAAQFEDDLSNGDSIHVRNAADFLGTTKEYKALPQLRAAITRGGLTSEAKIALVRAAGVMANTGGNAILVAGMADADPTVRVTAVDAWRDVLRQTSVTPVEGLLADADPQVRAHAATVVGAYGDKSVVATLNQLVLTDTDPYVRRNAAWALGRIGSSTSIEALTAASADKSGLVKGVAKAALATLKTNAARQ